MEPVKISLKRKEIPLDVELPDGSHASYVLRELSGDERDNYLNVAEKKINRGADGTGIAMRDYKGVVADLLCACVFDQKNMKVPWAEIQKWGTSAQKTIYDMAVKLSRLGGGKDGEESEREESAKNSEGSD